MFKNRFRHLCLQALQLGYEKMLADGQFKVFWEEDNLTAHLVEKIEGTGFLEESHIFINHQSPIYGHEIIYEGMSAKNAPIVDFKFSKWYPGNTGLHFYAEAKNLSENNWDKPNGASVDASYYRARYIDTGIENFLSGRYPEGCLVGYIVQGKQEQVISGINRLIESRKLLPKVGLIQKDSDVSFSTCYCSSHDFEGRQFTIRHVFMQFWKEG